MHSDILKETDITKEYGTGIGHDIRLRKGNKINNLALSFRVLMLN